MFVVRSKTLMSRNSGEGVPIARSKVEAEENPENA